MRIRQHPWRPAAFAEYPVIAGIEGMAWWQPFGLPFLAQRNMPSFLHQTTPSYGTGFAIPASIQGHAWFVQWRPPKFPPVGKLKVGTITHVTSFYDAFQPKGTAFGYIVGGAR